MILIGTYRWTGVDCDTHAAEVFVEAEFQRDVFLPGTYDKIVWSWFHIVHDFQGVWLDFFWVDNIPHVEPLWEN